MRKQAVKRNWGFTRLMGCLKDGGCGRAYIIGHHRRLLDIHLFVQILIFILHWFPWASAISTSHLSKT